jgi:hypothetical protein
MSDMAPKKHAPPAPEVNDQATPENNPANVPTAVEAPRRRRIPFSSHRRTLEVRPIPGYYLYWFRERNVVAAMDAGYEAVDAKEVYLNAPHSYGSLVARGGNTDLGSNVSVVADKSTGERMILMKLRMEYHLEDQAEDDAFDAAILSGIFTGEMIAAPHASMGATSGDEANDTATPGMTRPDGTTYVGKALFQRPTRKIRLMGGQAANPVGLNARQRPGDFASPFAS